MKIVTSSSIKELDNIDTLISLIAQKSVKLFQKFVAFRIGHLSIPDSIPGIPDFHISATFLIPNKSSIIKPADQRVQKIAKIYL